MAYEHVLPGFEMVIVEDEVKSWNLWWNVKLTDDPGAWDSEIELINEMQRRLGELNTEQRLIRAQMAEFCRLHPLFPRSIDILCNEIGDERLLKPLKIGCEGRGLLDSLGYHDPQSLNEQREDMLAIYAKSLKKWLAKGLPEASTESKFFGFLGQSTKTKEVFIEKLISVIDSKEPSISAIKGLSKNKCLEILGRSVFETRARPLTCFSCQEGCPEGASIPNCQCCYFMILDAGLLCSRASDEGISLFDEFSRFIEEHILAYAVAINSWLREEPPKHVDSLITASYISRESVLGIPERVYSSLGERDDVKIWLTACLLKTIEDNQRWHDRSELIDDFPEATSWFREQLKAGERLS